MSGAKFQLQTKALYNKQLESQMLDLWHEKIKTKKELKIIIEKIPDYKIHEETVSSYYFEQNFPKSKTQIMYKSILR